jgi:hypothetical protein
LNTFSSLYFICDDSEEDIKRAKEMSATNGKPSLLKTEILFVIVVIVSIDKILK